MTKQEFLSALSDALHGLPQSDIDERVAFYAEMIDDRMEEGLSEQEAVAAVGAVPDIVLQVVDEYPLQEIIKTRIRTRRPMSAFTVVLLVLGFPVWFSLLVAAFAVMLALYVVLWAVIVSFWSIFAALIGSAVGGVLGGVGFMCGGYVSSGLAVIAAALVCGGLSIFTFYGCKAASKGAVWLTKKMMLGIKKSMIRKEGAQ